MIEIVVVIAKEKSSVVLPCGLLLGLRLGPGANGHGARASGQSGGAASREGRGARGKRVRGR